MHIHIWRKRVGPEWLLHNSELLTARFGQRLAIIEEARHRFAILEVSCAHPSETRRLQNEFGGSARKLPRNWQRHVLKAKPRNPIRVGDRLMIATSALSREGGTTLVIPAATAFGTGEHVTTALSCARSNEFPAVLLEDGHFSMPEREQEFLRWPPAASERRERWVSISIHALSRPQRKMHNATKSAAFIFIDAMYEEGLRAAATML
jgi:hypothetical protein